MKQRVCVLGDGAWGTAFAHLLADNGHTVSLWCHDASVVHDIAQHRRNQRYLPGIQLPTTITPKSDLCAAVAGVDWIFEAVPVKFLRSVVERAKPCTTSAQQWVVLSKGIETDTGMLPGAVINAVLGYDATKAIISGPSFARDLAHKKITSVTVASADHAMGMQVAALLANAYFRPTLSVDMIGTQVGGALKNVIAVAIGMLDAAGYTDNTKVFILTRGLAEMRCITQTLGGQPQTVYGLSGLGDLVLTCMGSLSKNLAVGKQLGAGVTLDALSAQAGAMPEGINTIVAVNQLAHTLHLNLPLFQGVYRIIFERSSVQALLADLMSRPIERECTL